MAVISVPLEATKLESSNHGQLDALEIQGGKAGALASNALVDSNQATPGRVRIGLVSTSGISGDGAVITLTFKPLRQGTPASLSTENVEASDTNLRDLVVTASSGASSRAARRVGRS